MNTETAPTNILSFSDDDLAKEVVSHSERALEELYRRHTPVLRTVIMRIMGNDADIDDVMQEVFIQFWAQAERYCSDKGNLRSWLITMARRRALDQVRHRSAYSRATTRLEQEVTIPHEDTSEDSSVESEVQNHDLRSLLDRIIRFDLPKEQGEAVRLTYFDGLSQRQIAAKLSLPLGTVKTRIELGMRKLHRSAAIARAA